MVNFFDKNLSDKKQDLSNPPVSALKNIEVHEVIECIAQLKKQIDTLGRVCAIQDAKGQGGDNPNKVAHELLIETTKEMSAAVTAPTSDARKEETSQFEVDVRNPRAWGG